jgi:glycogen debranching enzyme
VTSGPAAAERPVLLRSLNTAVLLDGAGDVRLERETRGAPVEWGGVYGQQVRLTGPWALGWATPEQFHELPTTRTESSVVGDRFLSLHRAEAVEVRQQIVLLAEAPGAMRSLRFRSTDGTPSRIRVFGRLEPYLMPVLVEGVRPVDFAVETRADHLFVRHRGFALAYGADLPPSRFYVDRASWLGGRRRGPVTEIVSEHELVVPSQGEVEIRFAVAGGLERTLSHGLNGRAPELPAPEALAERAASVEESWLATTPELELPDDPDLERAYRWARASLRRLYSRPDDGMTGLVAGYPWYGAIWCRDLAWMLPAVLWLGDFDWARASIDTVLRFQANADLPLIAAEAGELPMQLSPGPIFLFGTSDTTLHYPALVRSLVRHSGAAAPASWEDPLARAIAWAERRCDPATGLVRNGGEVAAMERSEAGLTRVRYGIDAPDTTIWDSTDRREHAIDLQVLWHSALGAAVELLASDERRESVARWHALSDRLQASLPGRYAWPEQGYLADSLRDGAPVRRLRPNALRVVSAGLLDPALARTVVRRAATDDLTAAWGVRTLASSDPGYVPTAYHDGQVWTIATAWAADAAYAAGEPTLGLGFLRTIAARFEAEGGAANECYRGDRPEPFDSCFLLGFSVGPFLSALFERLWGLSVDARGPRLGVRPAFPSSWRRASLERLRVGDGGVSLRLRGSELEVAWRGPRPLTVEGPGARLVLDGGATGRLAVR